MGGSEHGERPAKELLADELAWWRRTLPVGGALYHDSKVHTFPTFAPGLIGDLFPLHPVDVYERILSVMLSTYVPWQLKRKLAQFVNTLDFNYPQQFIAPKITNINSRVSQQNVQQMQQVSELIHRQLGMQEYDADHFCAQLRAMGRVIGVDDQAWQNSFDAYIMRSIGDWLQEHRAAAGRLRELVVTAEVEIAAQVPRPQMVPWRRVAHTFVAKRGRIKQGV